VNYKFTRFVFVLVAIFLFSNIVYAHVTLNQPDGSRSYGDGSTMQIKWTMDIDHGDLTWELYYSLNEGVSWILIAINLDKSILFYNWKMPTGINTSQGRVKVVQKNLKGREYTSSSPPIIIGSLTNIVENDARDLETFILHPVYPNPFNGSSTISFSLNEPSNVEINIYNLLGEKVADLVSGELLSGQHQIKWNPEGLPSGMYLITVKAGNFIKTNRLNYLK